VTQTREVTCIICPLGCKAKLILDEGKVVSVTNIECPRGEAYAITEINAPVRDFFTTVKVAGARVPMLPVRATGPIPKDKLMACIREVSEIVVQAPIPLGTVIVKNLLNLGVDLVSTRSLDAR
jgi:CxxC motif-containing protein